MMEKSRVTNGYVVKKGRLKALIKATKIYDSLPEGWQIKEGAATAPLGYVWIWNGKSRFDGEYRHGLMEIKKEV